MLRDIVRDELRFLTFRPLGPGVRERPWAYLAFGLVFTWLAGAGRYWDNPRASLWQHLGLGSVAYVFVLALILWALLAPLRPRDWSYRTVLLFVTLTAPPAVLYAVPVERFLAPGAARAANAWFLGVVALWRVALLVVFLRRVARLTVLRIAVGTLLPLTAIVVTLALLNLEHVVFNLMSGIAPENRSPNDLAYQVVVNLAVLSMLLLPVVALMYIGIVAMDWRRRGRESLSIAGPPGG